MNSTLSPSVETTNDNNASASANNESKTKDIICTKSYNDIKDYQCRGWIMNMTRHMRYKDQKIKYTRKDSKLLELGWRCLNNDRDFEVGGSVVPLDKTSKSIQKKFRNIVRAHRSDWEFKLGQLCMSRSNDAGIIREYRELSEYIKKRLPKVNGKTVLDVSRMNSVVTTNEHLVKGGTVHHLLVECLNISMQNKHVQSSTTNLIEDYNEFLGLFPMRTQEHNTGENARFVLPNFQVTNLMGVALRANHNDSVAVLRGYAAALRLWSAREGDQKVQDRIYQNISYIGIVPDLLYHTVKEKFEEDTARPFFSINKIKRLEDELGIGMYSINNYRCNTCGVDRDNAVLKKCTGCSRVWYCGYECQKRNWFKHKPVCKAKWRTKPLYYETSGRYEDMKRQMSSSGLCIQVDAARGCLFAFCLDPITNEVFDGVTDRPVRFLPPSDGDGTDSKSTTSMSHTDPLSANEAFLEARTKRDVVQAKLVLAEEKVTTSAFMKGLMIGKKQEAEAELGRAQEVLALAQRYTTAQLDLALLHAGAPAWYHYHGADNTGPLELYSMAQKLLVDYVNHPETCTCSIRAERVGRINGNHCVRPTIIRLQQSGFVIIEGNGNNRKSGLDPEFAKTLALEPRFVINAGLVDTTDDEAP